MVLKPNENMKVTDNNGNTIQASTIIAFTVRQFYGFVAVFATILSFVVVFYVTSKAEDRRLGEELDKKVNKIDYESDKKLQDTLTRRDKAEIDRKLGLIMKHFGIIDIGQDKEVEFNKNNKTKEGF